MDKKIYAHFGNYDYISVLSNEKLDVELFRVQSQYNDINIVEVEKYKAYIKGEYYQQYDLYLNKKINLSRVYYLWCNNEKINIDISNLYDTMAFKEKFIYYGNDLGVTYTNKKSIFKVWSPNAKNIKLNLYKANEKISYENHIMNKEENGIFSITIYEDIENINYDYSVTIGENTVSTIDIYAKAITQNGEKGIVIDHNKTENVQSIENKVDNICDSIIYECHIGDLVYYSNGNTNDKCKFKDIYKNDTFINHLKELGVTHVQLLPISDFGSVDETASKQQYNWGYDPENYNAIEGSYCSNIDDGYTRINEYKKLINYFHTNGIGVIMDVVYNHSYKTLGSNFNNFAPKYYYRTDEFGEYTNGSACGNELNTEREMVRKFIVDSVLYYANEFKIDGFRFDLMGLIDIDTMNEIRLKLNKIDKNILVYGEGWIAEETPLKKSKQSIKANVHKMENNIAMFNDDVRDAIKGNVFEDSDKGFASGSMTDTENIKYGIVGCTGHSEINILNMKKKDLFWANSPTRVVNYNSCHDNLTLWDKLKASNPYAQNVDLIKMNKLAFVINAISQGGLFLHAGEEFGRTKEGNSNSYNAGFDVNAINWDLKNINEDLFKYYKGLIELRKSDECFRLKSDVQINKNIQFLEEMEQAVVIKYKSKRKDIKEYIVILNSGKEDVTYELNSKKANIIVDDRFAGIKKIKSAGNAVKVKPQSAMIVAVENIYSNKKLRTGAIYSAISIVGVATFGVATLLKKGKK